MLLNYVVQGFKSIDEEVNVDLQITNYKILSKSNVSSTGILKGLAFVGGNGSGKSNLLSPLKLLLDLLFTKSDIDLRNYFCLFSKEKHIVLTYNFLIRSCCVKYIIEITYIESISIRESLYVDDELVVFRDGAIGSYNSLLTPVKSSNIASNQLFIRDLYLANVFNPNKVLNEWITFLANSVYFNCIEQKYVIYVPSINAKSMLQTYESQVDDINTFLNHHKMDMKVVIKQDPSKISLRVKKNNCDVALPIQYESNGIKLLLKLLPAYYHVVRNNGLFILDEFEAMHPSLMKIFIEQFNEDSKFSQLFIASNNTSILVANVLRADQFYSVSNDISTKIKRFSSMQPRELQNMEKMYFRDVFGGLPKLK